MCHGAIASVDGYAIVLVDSFSQVKPVNYSLPSDSLLF